MSGDLKQKDIRIDSIKKCPICGGDLEQGYITAYRRLNWGKEKHSLMIGQGQENFANFVSWTDTNFHAVRCLNCHIVIFDYQNKG
jgi:hypothetical protein